MKVKKQTLAILIICTLMLLINILSHFFHGAVDWYIAHIFPLISGVWSRFSGLFPFSVGEWMIVAGIVLVVLAVPVYLLLVLVIVKKDHRPKAARIYGYVYGWILTWLFTVVTTRFLVLYQGTQLSRQLGEVTYSNEDVLRVCRMLVEGANAESKQVARDADGHFVMTDDLMPEAKACMERLAETCPQYKGYYPDAKPIYHSYFFTQQNLLGIYYPFSMEANYNPVVYEINLPVTVCHEYTHLKGNIFEDEAGYYGFLACMTSDSADFRYSGYISALEWLDIDFGEDDAAWAEYTAIMGELLPEVHTDLYSYVPEEYWEEHGDEEVIPTAIVSDTADVVMDTNLKINGISEGKHSYHGMTALLLHYYLGDL